MIFPSLNIRGTLRFAAVGLLAAVGACSELPSETDQPHDGPSFDWAIPIEGVSGGPCMTNYIDDGNGGCIYAPTPEAGGPTGGPTTPPLGGDETDPGTTGGGSEPGDTLLDDLVMTPVDSTKLAQIAAAVARLRTHTEYCAGAKRVLNGMVSRGVSGRRFSTWQGPFYQEDGRLLEGMTKYAGDDPSIEIDSRFVGSTKLLGHEAIHVWLWYLQQSNPTYWQQLMAPYQRGGAKYLSGWSPGEGYIRDGRKDEQCAS